MLENKNIDIMFIEKIKEINAKFEKFSCNKLHITAIENLILNTQILTALHENIFNYTKESMPKWWTFFSNVKPFMKELQNVLQQFPISKLYIFEIHMKNETIQKLLTDIKNVNSEYDTALTDLARLKQATGLSQSELELLKILQIRCENLEKDKRNLIENYAKALQKSQDLLAENTLLKKSCELLTEENRNLLTVIQSLENEHETLKQQHNELQIKYTRLENQINVIPLQTQGDLDKFYEKVTQNILQSMEQRNGGDKQCRLN
jgi:chromosome segregation ATPase